ncbi:MAG: hypothetical protein Q9170_001010 [Blastenia crenularia]
MTPNAPSTPTIPASEAASIPIPPTPSTAPPSTLSPDQPLTQRHRSRSPFPPKDFSFLLRPENFHAVPKTEVPLAFLSHPPPTDPLPVVLRHGHYHAAAALAAKTLTSNPSLSPSQIFSLFYTRLACLSIINHTPLAAQESLILGDLNSSFYFNDPKHSEEDDSIEDCILPWHLRILATYLQALAAGDLRSCVQGYYDLAAYARMMYKRAITTESKTLWKERLGDLGPRTGNTLIEMGDLAGAKRFFESLVTSNKRENEPLISLDIAETDMEAREADVLKGWVAMLCLRMGDLEGARKWIDASAAGGSDLAEQGNQPGILNALYSMAEGKYEDAVIQWRDILKGPNDVLATHNLAASRVLENMIDRGHTFHALTFNLATVYELRTERARERKTEMAGRVAEALGGREDQESLSKEKSNRDFKL